MLLNRHKWIQFFLLYYCACAFDYLEESDKSVKIKLLQIVNEWSSTVLKS